MGRARIDGQFTGRRGAEDPALTVLQRRLLRVEAGAYWQAFHRVADDVRAVASGDDGINPRAAGDVRGLQLGAHAAGAESGDAVAGDGAQRVVDAVDVFNQLRLRVATRVGGEQAWLVG